MIIYRTKLVNIYSIIKAILPLIKSVMIPDIIGRKSFSDISLMFSGINQKADDDKA